MKGIHMKKEQIREAILGARGCKKEDTPLCKFSTFYPDMDMVEALLKGADIQKSFNYQPLPWVYQFCEPNWDRMLELLFKYKYYGLHLKRNRDFEYLLRLLSRVKTKTALYVLNTMKKHGFQLTIKQNILLREEEFYDALQYYKKVFGRL